MSEETVEMGSTSQDDRIMAALGHATIIWPVMGIVAPLVIWATQREKSRFVGFQALQVITYQLVLVVGGFLGVACYMCSFFLMMFLGLPIGALAAQNMATPDFFGGLLAIIISAFPFCIMGILGLVGLAYVLYGLYGAVRVLQGHDFRYVIIGRRLEQYLDREVPVA